MQETDGFCAGLPIVLKFAGHSKTDTYVEEVIRTLSNYPASISHGMFAAKLLENLTLKGDKYSSEEIVELTINEVGNHYDDVLKSVDAVKRHVKVDHFTAVGDVFGRPCYNPGSFQVDYIQINTKPRIKHLIILINHKRYLKY